MNATSSTGSENTIRCETCLMRKKAEAKPRSFMARLWRWHTRWCPGWKAYQVHLAHEAQK
ncbi:MAG: hypothetical protein IBX69_14950 [Anaerolineales bacterium]|nr:hypothetical protein [Anaerolineales bacterium]